MPRVAKRAPQVQVRTGTMPAAHGLGLDRLASLCSTPVGSDSLGRIAVSDDAPGRLRPTAERRLRHLSGRISLAPPQGQLRWSGGHLRGVLPGRLESVYLPLVASLATHKARFREI